MAAIFAPGAGRSVIPPDHDEGVESTDFIERMALKLAVEHPVAAALARSARISEFSGSEDFAGRHGLTVGLIEAAEAGQIPFGALPAGYGEVLVALDVDLLAIADLARGVSSTVPA